MSLSEDEHDRYIFEKLQAAINAETEGLAREQPDLNQDRIKGDVRKIMAAYLRSQQEPNMTSEEEYWAGLQRFMADAYPDNTPSGEFEAVHNLVEHVKRRLGRDQMF